MFENIQALRAIAALAVVVVHAKEILKAGGITPHFLEFGYAGVDLFFVISGFIMVHTTRPSTGTGAFLMNRVLRVVPLYWLITFLVFAIAAVAPSLMSSTTADPVQLLLSLFFIPFERPNGGVYPTVTVGWTLNYEMAFYLLFAISLALPRFRVGLVCAVLALATLLHSVVSGGIAEFYTDPLILEFGAGMLLARYRLWLHRSVWEGAFAVIAGTLAILLLQNSGLHRIWSAGIPAVLIVGGAIALETKGRAITRLRLLGDASYAIYLTHFFVTQLFAKVAEKTGGDSAVAIVLFFSAFVIATVAGVIVHKLIEKPMTKLLRRKLLGRATSKPLSVAP